LAVAGVVLGFSTWPLFFASAGEEEVAAGGEDVLGVGAGHGVGERQARRLELLQERPGDRSPVTSGCSAPAITDWPRARSSATA
jgi:hypothetical protein